MLEARIALLVEAPREAGLHEVAEGGQVARAGGVLVDLGPSDIIAEQLGPALVVMGGHELHQQFRIQRRERIIAERLREAARQPSVVHLADDKADRACARGLDDHTDRSNWLLVTGNW